MGHVIGKYEHHDGCNCTLMVYIPDKGTSVPLEEALEIMTEAWIEEGEYADRTISDLVRATQILLEKTK